MSRISEETIRTIKDAVDVEMLLKTLGFSVQRVTVEDIRCPCKLHGGDNPTAFSMRLDTKKWKCFTKKCEFSNDGRSDNDLVSLVQKSEDLNFVSAVQFLADFAGLSLDVRTMAVEEQDGFKSQRDIQRYVRLTKRISNDRFNLPALSEDVVRSYVSNRDSYFLEKGFLPETLERFEVGAKFDDFGIKRATVPIRDNNGNLVSVSARREDGDAEPRYLLDAEFQKGKVLYNLHRAKESGSPTVIVMEGFKALWAMHEAGFSNTVACMGAAISEDQVAALCMAGFMNCLIMFDGDEAGIRGAQLAEIKLKKAFNTSVLYLPEGRSPDDFSRQELRDIVNLYIELF